MSALERSRQWELTISLFEEMQKCQVHADAITWCLGGWSVLNQAGPIDFRDQFRDAHRGKREFYGVFWCFMMCWEFQPHRWSVHVLSRVTFWFLRMFRWSCLMKNWRAKSLECVRCWYSPCARAKGRHHTPPPHPTLQHVMWVSKRFELQVSYFPSRKWDLCQLITHWLALLLWIQGILWSAHAKVESSGAEPSISSPALKWRWAGWTDEIKQNEEHDACRQDTPKKLDDGSTRDVKNRGFCFPILAELMLGASTRGSYHQTGSVLLSTPSQEIIMLMFPNGMEPLEFVSRWPHTKVSSTNNGWRQGLKPGFNSVISACALWLCKTECASKNFLPTSKHQYQCPPILR